MTALVWVAALLAVDLPLATLIGRGINLRDRR